MKKNKETVLVDFIDMTLQSWTFNRMTEKEAERCLDVLRWTERVAGLRGTYEARWSTLQAVYYAYLIGIGYDGGVWRETEEVPLF